MIVRHPTTTELEEAGRVGQVAFGHGELEHWVDSYKRRADNFGLDSTFVVEMDGKIVSSLLCTPGPIWCGGDVVTHSAVGAVATLPEYRKHGCAGAMMTETVKWLRDAGLHTSSLWPFSFPYYRKFGWELGCEGRHYSGKPEVFAALGDPSPVKTTAPDDLPVIMALCDRYSSSYAGPTKRNERWWDGMQEAGLVLDDDILPDGKARIFISGEGEPEGYAIYRWQETEGVKQVGVEELVAGDARTVLSLLAKIGTLEAESMTYVAPSDDWLRHVLDEPRKLEVKMQTGFQFRVVDPPAALASRTSVPGVSGKVRFELSDPVFSEGWCFTVEMEDGSLNITKAETEHTISTSVQVFARMFVSYLRPTKAVYLGRASASSTEAIRLAEAVFRPLVPFRSGMEPG